MKNFVIVIILLISSVSSSFSGEHNDREVFVQTSHNYVRSVALSPDGKYVMTGGWDGTAKLWETLTGLEIKTFVCAQDVESVSISPNGKHALTGEQGGVVELWDLLSYKKTKTFIGHKKVFQHNRYVNFVNSVYSAAFSFDGKQALTGTNDGVKLWDVKRGREIRTFSSHNEWVTYPVAFSPDGKFILTGGHNNDFNNYWVNLWDISGKKLLTIENGGRTAESIAFSPDNRYALIGDSRYVTIYDIKKRKQIQDFKSRTTAFGRSSLVFSSNGQFLLNSEDKTALLWQVSTGQKIKSFRGHSDNIRSVAISSDGNKVLTGSSDHTAKLWSAKNGNLLQTFKGPSGMFLPILSPCGRYGLLICKNHKVKLYDILNGHEIKTFDCSDDVNNAIFSPDLKYVLIETSKSVTIYKFLKWEKAQTFSCVSKHITTVKFSPNGRYVIIGTWDDGAELWEVSSGKAIRSFSIPGIRDIAFSPDGHYIIIAGGAHNSKIFCDDSYLFDLSSAKLIKRFESEAKKNDINSVMFSPDGDMILVGNRSDKLALWEISSGKMIRAFNIRGVNSAIFSPDGRYVIAGSSSDVAMLFEVSTGREIRSFRGHTGGVYSVRFSPDGKYVFTCDDVSLRIWKINGEKELCRFFFFDNDEWIAITPEGYYNSTQKGHQFINIRFKDRVAAIEQFYDVFYRPDIVAHKLKGQDISPFINITVDDALKSPPPLVKIDEIPSIIRSQQIKISYNVRSSGGGIGEIRVFQNGKLIQSDGFYKNISEERIKLAKLEKINSRSIYNDLKFLHKKTTNSTISQTLSKGNAFNDNITADVLPGENAISICAFNKDNTIQSAMQTIRFMGKVQAKPPHFYIISIGINEYKNSAQSLNFAKKDAVDFIAKLSSSINKLYKPSNIHKIILTDENATKVSIISKIEQLTKTVSYNDTVVFFIASHGVLLGDQYYMVTHDYNGNLSDNCLISSNEFIDFSKNIKSLKQVYVLDTCHAGGMDYLISGLYNARISVLAKKVGLHIFASSGAFEEALDGYKGNGLFTHHILKALDNNKAVDTNNDKKVSIIELGKFTKDSTFETAKKLGHDQRPIIINFGQDIPLYELR